MAAKAKSISLTYDQWQELEKLAALWRLGVSGAVQRVYEDWRMDNSNFIERIHRDEAQLRLPLEQK